MPDDNEIGYGKPPRANQFRKGQSGNPQGRPKGSANAATIFRKVSRELIVVKEKGGTRLVPKIEVVITQLLNKAASGDQRAIREVLLHDRFYDSLTDPEIEEGPDREKDDAGIRRLLARMKGKNDSDPEVG